MPVGQETYDSSVSKSIVESDRTRKFWLCVVIGLIVSLSLVPTIAAASVDTSHTALFSTGTSTIDVAAPRSVTKCPLSTSEVRLALGAPERKVASGYLGFMCIFGVGLAEKFPVGVGRATFNGHALSLQDMYRKIRALAGTGIVVFEPRWGEGAFSYTYSSNEGVTEEAYFGSLVITTSVTKSMKSRLGYITNELVRDALRS